MNLLFMEKRLVTCTLTKKDIMLRNKYGYFLPPKTKDKTRSDTRAIVKQNKDGLYS